MLGIHKCYNIFSTFLCEGILVSYGAGIFFLEATSGNIKVTRDCTPLTAIEISP